MSISCDSVTFRCAYATIEPVVQYIKKKENKETVAQNP